MFFDTKVHGIPCQCQVTMYIPPTPMRITGSGFGDADAPTRGEFDFELYDRKGHRARWIERHLKDDDHFRLADEFQAFLLANRFDIDF